MNSDSLERPRYPRVERILNVVAGWITGLRRTPGADVAGQARVTVNAAWPGDKGQDSGALLERLLAALGVDFMKRPFNEPALIQDLRRLCMVCEQKEACVGALASGTAARQYREYCPSAYTIDYMIGRGR